MVVYITTIRNIKETDSAISAVSGTELHSRERARTQGPLQLAIHINPLFS